LPPRQRAALVLRFYCDLNVDQSAQVLNCSPGTVKSQTAKAISTLRRALTAGHGGHPDVARGRSGCQEVPDHG
jgi:DNA-directed RNA polymerase specialized sigma24 family protein